MIPLNLTIAALFCIFAAVITGFASLITGFHYCKEKYRHALFITICWVNISICYIFQSFAELFLSKTLWFICCLCYIPLGFFIVLLLDSLTKSTIDPIKIAIISAESVWLYISSLNPNSIIIIQFTNGQYGMAANGEFLIAQSILYMTLGIFCVLYGARIYLSAPPTLSRDSRRFLLGIISFGIFPVVTVLFNFNVFFPSGDAVFIGVGALICTIALIKQPKFAYILPFKAYSLTILTADGGVPIFTYSWKNLSGHDEVILSGFISAISKGIDELIQKGHIRELILDKGIMILEYNGDTPIVFALIANESSTSLKEGLRCFKHKFNLTYAKYLDTPALNQNKIVGVETLVKECFPFVPEYED